VLNNFVSMVFATLKFLYDHIISQYLHIVFNDHKSVNYIFVNKLFSSYLALVQKSTQSEYSLAHK
jgi:hypothetical protein